MEHKQVGKKPSLSVGFISCGQESDLFQATQFPHP